MIAKTLHCVLAAILLVLSSVATRAQDSNSAQQANRTAKVGQTEVGQRQKRDEAAPNVHPLKRISSRIDNRINLRIQSRIDRFNSSAAGTQVRVEAAANTARAKASGANTGSDD